MPDGLLQKAIDIAAAGDGQTAYQCLVGAVAANPADVDLNYRLGCALHDLRRWQAAGAAFARTLALDAAHGRALANLGWNLHLGGRSEEGLACLERAVEAVPFEGIPWMNLSLVRGTLGDDAGGLVAALRGVSAQPELAVAHVALAFALFFNGKWLAGFREYQQRFSYKIPEFLKRPYPLWDGGQVNHLYLESEQGIGDSIMMLRYVDEARRRAERVTLYTQKELVGLCRETFPEMRVEGLPGALPEADAWAPLMSLPVALAVEGPGDYAPWVARPWLKPPRLAGAPLRVGIAWGGNKTHEMAHHRDCPLVHFFRLCEVAGVEVHSLQVGEQAAELSALGAYGLFIDHAGEISDMGDTARLVGEMDLVLTVDTAVAHLAGSMGCPTWLLLNQRGLDFRYGRKGETTEWYPGMKLWRRGLHERWEDVMELVVDELRRVTR